MNALELNQDIVQLEQCTQECPIVSGLEDEDKRNLLKKCASLCIGARDGQYDFKICGVPTSDIKNEMTRSSLALAALSRIDQLNTV